MGALDDCGCCEGADRLEPARANRAGLPAIAYRAGTHATFKAALLAQLSSTAHPALASLRTRSDDDFGIAACDATAVLLDVLTFYQERYANELYLRTAVERRSLLELARLIGYQLGPGVAANVHLAFKLQDAPGVPALAAEPVTIPIGTRVQSVPGPGEEPQTFETVEEVTARVEWNAVPVQSTERQALGVGTKEAYVMGVTTQLLPGDMVLIVGEERTTNQTDPRWKTRELTRVEPNAEKGWTRIEWATALDSGVAETNVRLYVFRLRTALFGHNAADPRMLRIIGTDVTNQIEGANNDRKWVGYEIKNKEVDLDGSFPKVQPDTWYMLLNKDGTRQLCLAASVKHLSRAAYGLSGKITRLEQMAGGSSVAGFKLEETVVFAESEELALVQRPLPYPLFGTTLALSMRSEELTPKRMIAVSGKRQRLSIEVDDVLQFKPDDGTTAVDLDPGDSFTLIAAPVKLVGTAEVALAPADLEAAQQDKTQMVRWRVADRNGKEGTIDATFTQAVLQPALKEDAVVSEICIIGAGLSSVDHGRDRTTLQLATALANVYDRASTTVCANLARATHGETVSEIAGSGKADTPSQAFRLKQAPLTHVSAATTSGRASTLEVRVNGLLWTEVETLFERDAREHVYALSRDSDEYTTARFGDGAEGARLLSGQDNVRFTYRKGLGAAGNVAAGRLTTLLGRPLGVTSANNPAPASGGEDAESLDGARRNAPLTMLTLGRAVSVQDYTDFARTFAGFDKAQALWVASGPARGVYITVAGPDGAAVAPDSKAIADLVVALRKFGDELLPLRIASYTTATFTLAGRIKVSDDALADDVLPAVEQTLRDHYAFGKRDFGQNVSIDEVMAVIHGVKGVEAVDIDTLVRVEPGAVSKARLFALPAQVLDDGTMTPAEILTLDEAPLAIEAMT